MSTNDVGANMARFAVGSIAYMAKTNPQLQIEGIVPHLGTQVSVHWGYFIALLVVIGCVQLGLWALGVRQRRASAGGYENLELSHRHSVVR